MSNEMLVRKIDEFEIGLRKSDGYTNATALCKAARKLWADYQRLKSTKALVAEMSSVMGIPITELIQVRQGGTPEEQGTWVHPDIAVNLAQWCSPRFAVLVGKWIRELLTTGSVSIQPASTGDAFLDSIKLLQQSAGAIADLYQRQREFERHQAETRQLIVHAQTTASAAMHQSTMNHGYFTVVGYSNLMGRAMPLEKAKAHGVKLSALCRKRGIEMGFMTDPRFGKVNSYPESLLREYFGDATEAASILSLVAS